MQPSCEPLSMPAMDLGFSASARAQPSGSRRNLLLPSHLYIPGRTDTACGWCWAGGRWDQTFPNTFPEPCQLQHTGIIASTFPFPGPFPGPSPFFSPSPGHPSPGVSAVLRPSFLPSFPPNEPVCNGNPIKVLFAPQRQIQKVPPMAGTIQGTPCPQGMG